MRCSFAGEVSRVLNTTTDSSEQAVARALTNVVDPAVLAAPMTRFHESLREPLLVALRAHSETQPDVKADIIGSMVVRASRDVWSPNKRTAQRRLRAALALTHNLLGPYLELPTGAKIVGERCVETNHAVREQRRGRDGDRRLVLVDASQDRPV